MEVIVIIKGFLLGIFLFIYYAYTYVFFDARYFIADSLSPPIHYCEPIVGDVACDVWYEAMYFVGSAICTFPMFFMFFLAIEVTKRAFKEFHTSITAMAIGFSMAAILWAMVVAPHMLYLIIAWLMLGLHIAIMLICVCITPKASIAYLKGYKYLLKKLKRLKYRIQ